MKNVICLLLIFIVAVGCGKKDKDPVPVQSAGEFVPTDVIVKTKRGFTIDKVFEFINQYDHSVEYISSTAYISSLAPDRLQYVLDYLNAKKYTNRPQWPVSGSLHYATNDIYVFLRLYDIKNKNNQKDWLQSIEILKMKELIEGDDFVGSIVYFHVPAGAEKEWVEKFKALPFVDWAETNNYLQISL